MLVLAFMYVCVRVSVWCVRCEFACACAYLHVFLVMCIVLVCVLMDVSDECVLCTFS